jgi:hypothetical protein
MPATIVIKQTTIAATSRPQYGPAARRRGVLGGFGTFDRSRDMRSKAAVMAANRDRERAKEKVRSQADFRAGVTVKPSLNAFPTGA